MAKFKYPQKAVFKAPFLKALLVYGALGFGGSGLVYGEEVPLASAEKPAAYEVHARIMFDRGNYLGALLLLKRAPVPSIDGQWILAESLLHLGRFPEARALFSKLLEKSADPLEKQKIDLRIFDTFVLSGDLTGSIAQYNSFTEQYKNPPAIMNYALGKALFDADYAEKSATILQLIPKNSEFYIRARYLLAVLSIDKLKAKESAKLFKQIEKMSPLSVEDYSIKQMAILAQARIYADDKRYESSDAAYERVAVAGVVGEKATIELIRSLMTRAEMALYGEGKYGKLSEEARLVAERKVIDRALKAIERYRKVSEIDWRKPELQTLMAYLFVKSRRYDEARLAYAELTEHYRPIYERLSQNEEKTAVPWSIFALDFSPTTQKPGDFEIPNVLLRAIPGLDEIMSLKHKIEQNGRRLAGYLERAEDFSGFSSSELAKARTHHQEIVSAYEALVKSEQARINKLGAQALNLALAEAEYRRAELALLEMRDQKKQMNANQQFQTEKINDFERELENLDKGGSL